MSKKSIDELMKKMKEYSKAFGDGSFPSFELGTNRSKEELCGIIDECLEKKKDVYELGYLSADDDVEY